VALSGNADILGIFGKLGKLLGIEIGVNLAVVASAILFKFEAIISFCAANDSHYLLYFEQHSFHL
jgi:hypothetical protein